MAYLVKQFVDHHLVRLLWNHWGVDTIAQYAQCLDMPSDIEILKRRQRWIGSMIKLQEQITSLSRSPDA